MVKTASWADVAAKGRAIFESDGVEIIREDAKEIEAYVMSIQVADEFPVTQGGIYDVILSKKSWENRSNVGGWIQGWLCDCIWGSYNSGQPGSRWLGRFCSHAYATMLASNMRARKDFMRDHKNASADNDFWYRDVFCQIDRVGSLYSVRIEGAEGFGIEEPEDNADLGALKEEARREIDAAFSEGESMKVSSVGWDAYNSMPSDEYLPDYGEGDTMATQIATAVNKLVYKYYNDGDKYHGELVCNDLSDYANWLYKYVPQLQPILWDGANACDLFKDGQYEDALFELANGTVGDLDFMAAMDKKPAQGSVYSCDGPFSCVDYEEDEYDYYDEDEDEDDRYASKKRASVLDWERVENPHGLSGCVEYCCTLGRNNEYSATIGIIGEGEEDEYIACWCFDDTEMYEEWGGGPWPVCDSTTERDTSFGSFDEAEAYIIDGVNEYEQKWYHSRLTFASRKTAGFDWQPANGLIDPEEMWEDMWENEGCYIDEAYVAYADGGLYGIVQHQVFYAGNCWAWDTYKGDWFGLDCGLCDTKEQAIAKCEQSLADWGSFTGFIGASKNASKKKAGIEQLQLSDFEVERSEPSWEYDYDGSRYYGGYTTYEYVFENGCLLSIADYDDVDVTQKTVGDSWSYTPPVYYDERFEPRHSGFYLVDAEDNIIMNTRDVLDDGWFETPQEALDAFKGWAMKNNFDGGKTAKKASKKQAQELRNITLVYNKRWPTLYFPAHVRNGEITWSWECGYDESLEEGRYLLFALQQAVRAVKWNLTDDEFDAIYYELQNQLAEKVGPDYESVYHTDPRLGSVKRASKKSAFTIDDMDYLTNGITQEWDKVLPDGKWLAITKTDAMGAGWFLYPSDDAYMYDDVSHDLIGNDSPDVALEHFFDKYPQYRTASKKQATRSFTYAEQKELEDEVIDKPWLNNADRLKDPDILLSF